MTTVQNIIDYSKPHMNQMDGARQTILSDERVRMSIVGGSKGLYGDFEKDFEVAILDQETDEFVTRFFRPEVNDDVLGYLPGEELIQLIEQVFKKGFQVH
jgi:hypothetical protein